MTNISLIFIERVFLYQEIISYYNILLLSILELTFSYKMSSQNEEVLHKNFMNFLFSREEMSKYSSKALELSEKCTKIIVTKLLSRR